MEVTALKIVITNAFTWYNKGDSGILLATVDTLKKIYGNNISIDILSFTPDEDKLRYCNDPVIKNVYSNVLNPYPYKRGKLGKIFAMIKVFFQMIKTSWIMKFHKKSIAKKPNLNALADADMIIVCGGGFLGGKKYTSLMHLYQMSINARFNKPIYVMGTSIEPITSNIIKKNTEKTLKKMSFVFARETITYNYLTKILPKDKYALIPDIAFMLEPQEKTLDVINQIKQQNRPLFGITIRRWTFPHSTNKKASYDNYINAVKIMMEHYIDTLNAYFIYIPQVIVETGNDTYAAQDLLNKLPEKYKTHFIILTDDLAPGEIKSVISQMDYFVGTRMHSNIFATSMSVPTIAIAYEKKTNGIMHTLELDEYVLEIDSITSSDLIQKIDLMIDNSQKLQKHLKTRISEIQQEILNTLESNIIAKK